MRLIWYMRPSSVSTFHEAHPFRPGAHFADQPRLDLDAPGRRGDRLHVVAAGDRDHADSEVEDTAHFAERQDRKSTRLNSSHVRISYAVFCLKKKKKNTPPRP